MQGEFQVSNERIIDSIPLQSEEHVYAKFIKVRVVLFVLLLILLLLYKQVPHHTVTLDELYFINENCSGITHSLSYP